jgi:uncharacterized protein (TIGR04255 family)
MSTQPYKRPPITEAVVEIRFAPPIDTADLGGASSRFAALYPRHEDVKTVGVQVGIPPGGGGEPTTQIDQQLGHKRSTSDLSEILVMMPLTFTMSQLAPYPGWNDFFGRFVRDWKVWKGAVGFRKIFRIGVRFINRIDIRIVENFIEEAEYLNIYPKLPEILGASTGYGVQVQLPIRDMGCSLVINSASVPSPLLDHGSILLDIDVSKSVDPPQNDEDIYGLLNSIRTKKNDVFEACVTDQARGLFQK